MNPADALALNPRPTPKDFHGPASAPEAADWLKHPVKLIERVSLAMQLAAEPEYDGPIVEDNTPMQPVVTDENGAILLA